MEPVHNDNDRTSGWICINRKKTYRNDINDKNTRYGDRNLRFDDQNNRTGRDTRYNDNRNNNGGNYGVDRNTRYGSNRDRNDRSHRDRFNKTVEPIETKQIIEKKIDLNEFAQKFEELEEKGVKFYPPWMTLENIFKLKEYSTKYKEYAQVHVKAKKECDDIQQIQKIISTETKDCGSNFCTKKKCNRCLFIKACWSQHENGNINKRINDLDTLMDKLTLLKPNLINPLYMLFVHSTIYGYLINGTHLLGDIHKISFNLNFNYKEFKKSNISEYGVFPNSIFIDSAENYAIYLQQFDDIKNTLLKIKTRTLN